MRSSSFERLARSVVVRDLCEPTRCVDVNVHEQTVGDLMRDIANSEHPGAYEPVLLQFNQEIDSEGLPVYLRAFPYAVLFPERVMEECVDRSPGGELFIDYAVLHQHALDYPSEFLTVFTNRNVLPGDTSVWELLNSAEFGLSAGSAGLVVRGVSDFGVITLDTLLHRPEAKACWLTLSLELEVSVLGALKCQNPVDVFKTLDVKEQNAALQQLKNRVDRVPQRKRRDWVSRLVRAGDVAAYRSLEPSPSNLLRTVLEYTTFAQKKKMLLKTSFKLPGSKSAIKATFELAENLRNWCAHPTSHPEFEFRHLGELRKAVFEIHNLGRELRDSVAHV